MIYPVFQKIGLKIIEKEQKTRKKMYNNVMTSIQPYKY